MAYIPEPTRFTNFDETVIGQRIPILNYKPTWGPSKINYDITEVSGGTVSSAPTSSGYEGTIKLSTTGSSSEATMETKLLGQYQAGNQAEVGWGVIIPTAPTGDQKAEWSFSSRQENSGIGFGLDANEPYVYYIREGTKYIISQSNWNNNTLTGELDFADGIICQAEFTWYGFGPIEYYIQRRSSGGQVIRTLIHSEEISGSLSISDPNQPIRFTADNGTSTNDFHLYVAGHQFSIIAGTQNTRKRPVAYDTGEVALENTSDWQPIVAVRRKSTFNNKENTINATVKGFQGRCSADATFKLTTALQGTITNPTYSSHPDWGDESAVEITDYNDAVLTASGATFPAAYRYVTANGREEGITLKDNKEILLGNGSEGILWVKLDSASPGETAKATVEWQEEW